MRKNQLKIQLSINESTTLEDLLSSVNGISVREYAKWKCYDKNSVGHFTSRHVRVSAGIGSRVSDETVRRVMRSDGLNYRYARKKELLTKNDLKVRLQFGRKVKRKLGRNFWKQGVSFYLDGVSFTHKFKSG